MISDLTPEKHYTLFEDVQGLLLASTQAALGIHLLRAAGLVTGGTAGAALIISYAMHWNFSLVFFAINIPFYGFAWWARGPVRRNGQPHRQRLAGRAGGTPAGGVAAAKRGLCPPVRRGQHVDGHFGKCQHAIPPAGLVGGPNRSTAQSACTAASTSSALVATPGTAFQPEPPSTIETSAPSMIPFSRHQIRIWETRPPSWPFS